MADDPVVPDSVEVLDSGAIVERFGDGVVQEDRGTAAEVTSSAVGHTRLEDGTVSPMLRVNLRFLEGGMRGAVLGPLVFFGAGLTSLLDPIEVLTDLVSDEPPLIPKDPIPGGPYMSIEDRQLCRLSDMVTVALEALDDIAGTHHPATDPHFRDCCVPCKTGERARHAAAFIREELDR